MVRDDKLAVYICNRNKKLSLNQLLVMCNKSIICLGNSYKNGGRCLAGIEVKKTTNGYIFVKDNDGLPKWIRPVMADSNRGIPENMVRSFRMLDILEVDVTSDAPYGAHSENVHFRSISKVGYYNGSLMALCDENHSLIFGNRGKAVPEEIFCEMEYSLMFVKPENLYIDTQYDEKGREKYRIQFSHKGNRYDFPLTDPVYISMLQKGCCKCGNRSNDIYLTLSLGVNYNDWHYKLVAGVIDMAA